MAGLKDLASMLGMEEPSEQKPVNKKGYDGNTVILKVRVEQKRGKKLTVISGFQSHPKELHDLLATFKKSLGTGGQVTDNKIEIQGDHRERVIKVLEKENYKVKK